jgi:hypothetical protein
LPPIWGASRTTTCSTSVALAQMFWPPLWGASRTTTSFHLGCAFAAACRPCGRPRDRLRVPHRPGARPAALDRTKFSVAAPRHLLDEWGSGLRDRPGFVRFRRLDGDSPRRGAGVARAAEAEQKLIHIPQVGYPGWAGKPAFRRRVLAQTGVSRGG